jgi:pterin-4a-carbinolamine dehydratase
MSSDFEFNNDKPDLSALRKRYPKNFPIPPDKLDEKKLLLIVEQELKGWQIVVSPIPENPSQNRVELFREYMFSTFDQVLEYMSRVAPICNTLPHHPRWENTWTTLKIYLSTWDSNHIISYKDIMLARHMESIFKEYGETFINVHSSTRIEKEINKFISSIELLEKKGNLNEAFNQLSQYLSQPQEIFQRETIFSTVNKYNQFIEEVVQKKLAENEINENKIYFEKELSRIIELLKYFKPKIFFSYAWGEEKEKLVDQLYNSLKNDDKYELVRDKVNLGYKGLISDFMKTIGKGSFVVVVLSNKYLHSEYCMFELYELYRNSSLETAKLLKKIYPIRLEELNLDSLDAWGELSNYWQDQFEKIEKLGIRFPERYRKIKSINNELGALLEFLRDINALTVPMLSKDDFAEIKKAIKDRVSELS